jgi:DNA-binding MurR/RpiR family transcriptional regulator
MSAKIEPLMMSMLSIMALLTKNDIVFVFTITGYSVWILRNLPAAIKVIKSIKKK